MKMATLINMQDKIFMHCSPFTINPFICKNVMYPMFGFVLLLRIRGYNILGKHSAVVFQDVIYNECR